MISVKKQNTNKDSVKVVGLAAEMCGFSKRTLERRMHEHGVRVLDKYADISQQDLNDIVATLLDENENLGEHNCHTCSFRCSQI